MPDNREQKPFDWLSKYFNGWSESDVRDFCSDLKTYLLSCRGSPTCRLVFENDFDGAPLSKLADLAGSVLLYGYLKEGNTALQLRMAMDIAGIRDTRRLNKKENENV